MTTAVVITTIVSHDSDETGVVDQLFEQICAKDRDLRTVLANLGLDAKVTSAIVNIGDVVRLAQGSLKQPQAEAPVVQTNGAVTLGVHSAELNEMAFMDSLLEQIQNGDAPSYARLSTDALEEMADEPVGEHLSQHPFLY